MKQVEQGAVRNRLLKTLSPDDFGLIASRLLPIRLPFGSIVEIPGEPIDFVVFVESGVASRLVIGNRDEAAESSHIGNEGMTGRPVLLGASVASNRIQMQVGGEGLSVPSTVLRESMEKSGTFRDLMMRYVHTVELQIDHSLLAATNYDLTQRLARWLLMYHDRIDGDEFPVTHELLSVMMNVRRAGVTGAIHVLEGEHAIVSSRGSLRVSDRAALAKLAGGSYGIPEAMYESLIPPVTAGSRVLQQV